MVDWIKCVPIVGTAVTAGEFLKACVDGEGKKALVKLGEVGLSVGLDTVTVMTAGTAALATAPVKSAAVVVASEAVKQIAGQTFVRAVGTTIMDKAANSTSSRTGGGTSRDGNGTKSGSSSTRRSGTSGTSTTGTSSGADCNAAGGSGNEPPRQNKKKSEHEGDLENPTIVTELTHWTDGSINLVERMTVQFPVTISMTVGTPPEYSSLVRQLVQQMNAETFPSIGVTNKNGFVSGHLQSQSYGGRGNDQNCVPMTHSLNQLYHSRLEKLIKALRTRFNANSRAYIELQIRNRIEIITSTSGRRFPYVARIRVNVRLFGEFTEEENEIFRKLFRENPDFLGRTEKVTIQLTNKKKSDPADDAISSKTNEDEVNNEDEDDDEDD